MFQKILNLIFPNVCGFCNKINENSLCIDCEKMLSKYKLERIKDCKEDKTKYFDFSYCALKYEGIVREKIISYKFGEKSYLYKTFAKIIINNKKIYDILKLYDIILPVPMHKSKESVRGYNQSALLAMEIANSIGIKFKDGVLVKIKDTNIQSSLTKKERHKNLNGAFKVKDKGKIINKKVVLVDDIYTTGSTVNECSKVLKNAGAKEILVVTIAKD